ncbi:MAG: alpha/beta fold hydrolase [Pseudomonadota bacterium]
MCFPHAGGGVLSAAKLARSLPDRLGLLTVTLPGREPGDTAAAPRRATEAGSQLAGDLVECIKSGDVSEHLVLLGNSYGSLLAFETTRSLQSTPELIFDSKALRLIVSGFRSPSLPPSEAPLFRLPTQDLYTELAERFGVAVADLEAAGLYGLEDALRADLEACDTYRMGDGPKLENRIDVLRMTQDPSVSLAELRSWQDVTTGSVVMTEIAAGHFPWVSQPDAVAAAVIALTADFEA